MLKWVCRLALLLFAPAALAQGTAAIQDHCYLGGTQAKVSGLNSTNYQLGIVPSCTVTVYLTGTQTKATIFRDASGTSLPNPFTANAVGSLNPGGWIFWSAVNTGYDIVLSGGISPNTYLTPITLTDRYPGFSFSGGGGSVTPCGQIGQIQIANSGGTALDCDPNFFINSLTHTRNSTANDIVNAWESVPRNMYDPMSTKYCATGGTVCGLAAAVAAGGAAPTQVIQAAMDYGKCQSLRGLVATENMRIPLPTKMNIPITGLKLWTKTDFGAYSVWNEPILQHTDATQPMIMGHVNGDTITCSNGTTYTPNETIAFLVHNFLMNGLGSPNTDTDIGIWMNSTGSMASEIGGGAGNAFGGPAIFDNGVQNFIFRAGYPASQMAGCQTYTTGVRPVSGFTLNGGRCEAVVAGSTDGEADYVYASDGQGNASPHPAGSCYPKCAAIGTGNNGHYNHLFTQVSDIDIYIGGSNSRLSDLRADAVAREGILVGATANNNVIDNVVVTSACRDTAALQAAYAAGTPTGCPGINDPAQGNQWTNLQVGAEPGIFGASYYECSVSSGSQGSAAAGGTYSNLEYRGNPQNATRNDMAYCGQFGGDQAAGRATLPSMSPMQATGALVNVSGVTNITLTTTTPVTHITGGIGGQQVTFQGISGASIVPGTVGGELIFTCNGMPETSFPSVFENTHGYVQSGTTPSNIWSEICNSPNTTPMHVNWLGNPTPTDPSLLDIYGNAHLRQVPAITNSTSQLHGPTAGSGQYCFEQENVYADGSHNVTALFCTNTDLTNQTPGEIFVTASPQTVANNLWLVSNTTGSGIATGKYPAPSGGFWDGPTTIAAGGNGATPPAAGENTTGAAYLGFGIRGPATAPTGTCTAFQGGMQVPSQDGHMAFCPVGGGTWTNKY